jgi:2,4-dienoyl-CoA reductase-like NADH-dependent reductase (Old Yellow Enzyme family)
MGSSPDTQFLHEDNAAVIFSPLKFRRLVVKNRLLRSSISGTFDDYNGHGTNARLNWEEKFARGGIGAIISSFVPVTPRGRILPRYAMIDDDDKIPFWRQAGKRVHAHNCHYLMQLSHSGRQQDTGGVENLFKKAPSSTSNQDFFHGIQARAMSLPEIREVVEQFAQGARRAREAGLDGVELHGANGYLITQFLSSGINNRDDDYGGSVDRRARFALEIVRAIRREVGHDFHLQMKINGVDHNNWLYPWEKKGNQLDDTLQICKLLMDDGKGVDAFHISSGSTFPHPRNPPGDMPIRTLARCYEVMLSKVHRRQRLGSSRMRHMRHETLVRRGRRRQPVPRVRGQKSARRRCVDLPTYSRVFHRRIRLHDRGEGRGRDSGRRATACDALDPTPIRRKDQEAFSCKNCRDPSVS